MSTSESRRRLRVLFLLPFAPRLDARHGGRAIAHLLLELGSRHDVAAIYLRAPDEDRADDVVAARCARLEEVALPRRRTGVAGAAWTARLVAGALSGMPMQATELSSRAYAARLDEVARDFRPALVQVETQAMAPYFAAVDERRVVRVLSIHEPAPTLDYFRAAHGLEAALRRLDVRTWQGFERRVLSLADAIVAFTDEDARAMREAAPGVPVEAIPLQIPVPATPLDPLGSPPSRLLFVGGLRHPPNIDAALRLATEILPRVKTREPAVVLEIVGGDAPERLRALAGGGVILAGAVLDVAPHLDRAAVFAAPLRAGGGMRVKMIEAMAAGKAVVASRLAARGLEVRDGDHLLLAETDEEFADAIVRLLANPALRAALAASARAWACERFKGRQTIAAYESLYGRLLTR